MALVLTCPVPYAALVLTCPRPYAALVLTSPVPYVALVLTSPVLCVVYAGQAKAEAAEGEAGGEAEGGEEAAAAGGKGGKKRKRPAPKGEGSKGAEEAGGAAGGGGEDEVMLPPDSEFICPEDVTVQTIGDGGGVKGRASDRARVKEAEAKRDKFLRLQSARDKASGKLREAIAAQKLPLLHDAVKQARACGMEGREKGVLWRFELLSSALAALEAAGARLKVAEEQRQRKLAYESQLLRREPIGIDRHRRRYWSFPGEAPERLAPRPRSRT